MPLISDVTAALVGKVLDLENLRAEVASRNIANANVQGFSPQKVDFEDQLAAVRNALQQPQSIDGAVSKFEQTEFSVKPEASQSLLNASVNLDSEVTTLTLAKTQYEALVESLNRHFGLMRLAITGRE